MITEGPPGREWCGRARRRVGLYPGILLQRIVENTYWRHHVGDAMESIPCAKGRADACPARLRYAPNGWGCANGALESLPIRSRLLGLGLRGFGFLLRVTEVSNSRRTTSVPDVGRECGARPGARAPGSSCDPKSAPCIPAYRPDADYGEIGTTTAPSARRIDRSTIVTELSQDIVRLTPANDRLLVTASHHSVTRAFDEKGSSAVTIAISIKVNDGLVLAADSAATIPVLDAAGNMMGVSAVYNNANKVFNLQKGQPIGAVTWGLGGIGVASIATLMKDLRARFSGKDNEHPDWKIDPDNYAMEEVAQRFFQFIYEETYLPAFRDQPPPNTAMGFFVSGYSSNEGMAEEFLIEIRSDGSAPGPVRMQPKEEAGGIAWNGETDAIHRLVFGFGAALPTVLEQNLGIPAEQAPQVVEILKQQMQVQLLPPAMPIQDAIDLAEFLADFTARFSRFTPGAATVGGPIELAAITKHEGFKWVRRKYYYSRQFNPEEQTS